MDRLECCLLLPWDSLIFTSAESTLKMHKTKKNKIKEADESFRNPKCHTQVWSHLLFWEQHGTTVLPLMTHSHPCFLLCSVCRCEAALKETNREWPRVYSSPGSSHHVCLCCSSTERCVCRNEEPLAVHGRRGGQQERVLKTQWMKFLYLSKMSNGIQGKNYSPCCPIHQSHLLSFHLKEQTVAFFSSRSKADFNSCISLSRFSQHRTFSRLEAAEPKTTKRKS